MKRDLCGVGLLALLAFGLLSLLLTNYLLLPVGFLGLGVLCYGTDWLRARLRDRRRVRQTPTAPRTGTITRLIPR